MKAEAPAPPTRRERVLRLVLPDGWRPPLSAVALAVTGGLLFAWAGLPLPWMLGAMLATTLASLSGLRIAIPASWRPPTIAVLGVMLGSGFTEEVAARILLWLPSFAALPFYIVVVGIVAMVYLRKIGRLDPRTTFFCATPGGLGEMVVLGDRSGGDMRTIAMVHGTRILLVVFLIPFSLQALGYENLRGVPAGAVPAGPLDLALMALCGLVGAVLGNLLRLPAPALLGPMLLSAAAHLWGLVHGAPPVAVVAAAQLLIGASVGCRFTGMPVVRVLWSIVTGFGLTVLMLGVAVGFGALVSWATGLPLLLLVLAFSPGGLAEMSLIALALTDDPAFVAANHIVRIGLVVILATPLFALYRRFMKLPPQPEDDKRP